MTRAQELSIWHVAGSPVGYDECSFIKSLEKTAAEGVRLPMPSAAYAIQSKIGCE